MFIVILKYFCIYYLIFITRPYKIISITPKVGLIVTIISKILFIKNLHFITGQVWHTKIINFQKTF